MAKDEHISMSVVRRLPRYYRFLYDLKENGIVRISSRELSQRMGLTASQIRQDLNCFGGFGQQGYGYIVEQLYTEIGHILGVDVLTPTILLGAGNMGHAVANHMDFEQRGIRLISIFDNNPALIGQKIQDVEINPIEKLDEICTENKIEAAILCIPNEVASQVVERLIKLGVRGFWNFSHYDISYNHPGVLVENVHLGDSLMTLSYKLNENR
ncbi:MAG: redox-sensing transcriptional repressor Rex [Oscillospiraceae bacterium]|nr:redox-sensing transcriptional repressor Rex [Oscillospiraceae bacterium]MDD4413107.1 redox-sensing transcriptional repressor Rex [Oscillospiraceae bacterium]